MLNTLKISLFLFVLGSTTGSLIAQPDPDFIPLPADFEVDSPKALHAINIPYEDEGNARQIFHLFVPDTVGTFPLVVFIHGGGFTGGNPGKVFIDPKLKADIKYFLENGFAYASFGYRLINSNGPDTEGVIKSLNDSKRALQYIRHYANELNIDPTKIALTGSSAGAGTSLWLGTRSDMANPNAMDPVLKESTRVCAVVANGSQATYDLYKWETEIYQNFDGQGTNFTLDSMVNLLGFDRASNFYGGIDSVQQILNDPALIQYRQDVDMLFHMSSDDPPIFINSQSQAVHPNQDLFHHSFHGQAIQDAAIAAGVSEVKANISALLVNTTDGESRNDFLIRHLNSCALATSSTEVLEWNDSQLSLFPNPAKDQFSVQLLNESIKSVEIYDLQGGLIRRENIQPSNTVTVSNATLASGAYFIRVWSEKNRTITKKLIIE